MAAQYLRLNSQLYEAEYFSHSLNTFTFLFLAFLCSCSEEENNDLPRLPETISGKLDHITVVFNFGESFRGVSFFFKDYNKEPIQSISVELPLKGRPANAE